MLRRGFLILLAAIWASSAACVELVVNHRVPLQEISRSYAQSIFAARVAHWPDGTPLRVFVLADESPLHQAMTKNLLDLFPYQLRQAWARVTYTGLGQAPIEVSSEAEMLRRVATVPGAIGYLGKVERHDSVRTLRIR